MQALEIDLAAHGYSVSLVTLLLQKSSRHHRVLQPQSLLSRLQETSSTLQIQRIATTYHLMVTTTHNSSIVTTTATNTPLRPLPTSEQLLHPTSLRRISESISSAAAGHQLLSNYSMSQILYSTF